MVQIRFPKPWLFSALRQKTDYQRWSNPRHIYSSWESRTEWAANFIPKNSRVIEFGAATRILERFLDPSCTYTPSDIVDRGPGTLVLDLNERPLPNLDGYDAAVIVGVLEYIVDVPAVADWLSEHFPLVVTCYAPKDGRKLSWRSKLGSVGRASSGWMNNYLEDEFRSIFLERGYTSIQEATWKEQRLFVFSQNPIRD